jgi:hypothetical protein
MMTRTVLAACILSAMACRPRSKPGAAADDPCIIGKGLVGRWLAADTAGAWNSRPGTAMPWDIADTVDEEGGGDGFTIAVPGATTCTPVSADSVTVSIPWQVIGGESAPDGRHVAFQEDVYSDTTALTVGRGSGRWLIHGWSRLARPSPEAALEMWQFPPAQQARIKALADGARRRGA